MNPGDDTTEDRRWRHYIEGQVQNAVLAATTEIQQDISLVKRALFGDDFDPKENGLVGDVRTIKGWLVGETNVNGEPINGIAKKVRDLWALRMWVVGLLASGVAVAFGAFILAAMQALHLIPSGKY